VIATTSDAGNVSSNPSSSAWSNRCRLFFFLAFRFGRFDLVVGIISSALIPNLARATLVELRAQCSFPLPLHIPYFEDYAVVFCSLDIGM